jgi:hypothetical protein
VAAQQIHFETLVAAAAAAAAAAALELFLELRAPLLELRALTLESVPRALHIHHVAHLKSRESVKGWAGSGGGRGRFIGLGIALGLGLEG